ncbi:hypothetical protein [Maritimibacter sp. HL-12]|uniref:hypothetical protein n=1 Tax=Maritimibacter sp. HL-12 TaxID=1162418 RepID=UPI000A0F239C|nr:hypothetical protein [Maritimibacter sp. HL-12]SMH51271.1 hypothetical protein SAMN05661107_2465 [Maritimibacter sp. HL-12]
METTKKPGIRAKQPVAPADALRNTYRPSMDKGRRVVSLDDKEFPAYPKMFNGPVEITQPTLVASRDLNSVSLALDWFRAQGVKSYHLDSFADAVTVVLDAPRAWSYLLVDIDDFGGVEGVIDELMQLRKLAPSLPVILLSSGFAVNDYGTERLYVTDASLRLPLTLGALEVAVEDAPMNNREWRQRLCA